MARLEVFGKQIFLLLFHDILFCHILCLKVISDLLQESILYKCFYFLECISYLCTIWW